MKLTRESRNIVFLGLGFMMIYTSNLTSRARQVKAFRVVRYESSVTT